MSTVYVVNPPKKENISSAEKYGDLKYISFRYVFGDEIEGEEMPLPVLAEMLKLSDRFDPQRDFLLIVGDHLQIIQFSAMLAARHGRFRVLRYDRQAGDYYPVWIDGSPKLARVTGRAPA